MIDKKRFKIKLYASIDLINSLIINYAEANGFNILQNGSENYYTLTTEDGVYNFKYRFENNLLILEIWSLANNISEKNIVADKFLRSLNALFKEIDKQNYLNGGPIAASSNKKKLSVRPKLNVDKSDNSSSKIDLVLISYYLSMLAFPLSILIKRYALFIYLFNSIIVVINDNKKNADKHKLNVIKLLTIISLILCIYLVIK